MPHHTPLTATIVVGIVTAFLFGVLANRLRISPLAGYLLAGVAVGPFTPGFVADQNLAGELAEIGIILLMFGVGLHFSIKDLMSVRAIAIPGALAQIAVATTLGAVFAHFLGWTLQAGLIFGLALSVASTVVLIRALQERHLIDSERGRIAIGWLIVEDLAMVIALVVLPTLGGKALGAGAVALTLLLTLAKAVAFVAVMLLVGRKIVPMLLHYVAHTGSRELFRLAVLAIALGVAYGAAVLFGVSFALGAFFAGMILSESQLSQRAAEESLPLRDAFAVLFFVSVGMLFNPRILLTAPLEVLAVFLIIVLGKSLAAYFIVRLFGHKTGVALTVSASLAQIGEFSFILAGIGVALDILPGEGRDLILAGALLSILVNPLVFSGLDRVRHRIELATAAPATAEDEPDEEPHLEPTEKSGHIVVVGFGRVGRIIHGELQRAGAAHLVVEVSEAPAAEARAAGVETLAGNAVDDALLKAANIEGAKLLFVAIPNSFEAGQIVEQARVLNPALRIIARAHSEDEVAYLYGLGADITLMGEREIALGMVAHAFELDAVMT